MADGGRLLDLYGGAEPPGDRETPRPPSPTSPTPPERAPAPADWLEVLWKGFPRAIRERYVPRALIGEGGMGIVLEAEDRELRRVVAIKGVRDPRGISADERLRHAREARISARLTHPNILPVFDTWNDGQGNAWCSMLRVPGSAPTLANRLAEHADEGAMARRLQVFLQVCRATAYAHAHGVVHRDLKPENVLIGPTGEALVADWGVAISPEEPPVPGEVAGTPGYAAPEQLGQGGEVRADARSDVHALGVMLTELLGGSARTPRELAAIARRATAREPAERYADAGALQRAVETFLEGGLVEGMEYSAVERAVKWLKARPAVVIGLGALALFVATSLANGMRVSARLAVAEAALAEGAWVRGERMLARDHAARAFQAREGAYPGFVLPRPLATAIFLAIGEPDRLLDARTMDFAAEVALFDPVTGGVVVGTRKLSWWTFKQGEPPRGHVKEQSQVWGLAISVVSRRVASAGAEGPVKIYDLDSGEQLATLTGHTSSLWALAFSPDGKYLATGSFDRTVRVWDVAAKRCLRTLEAHRDPVWIVAWSPDGKLLGSGSIDGTVHVWDPRSGQSLKQVTCGREPIALAFSPGDPWIAVGSGLPYIEIKNWETDRSVRSLHTGASALSLSFLDRRTLASGGHHSKIEIWDMVTGERKHTLSGHSHWVSCVSFSPDGKRLASASQDSQMRVWDIAEQAERKVPFQAHARSVTMTQWTTDSKHLLTGDVDGVNVWSVPAGDATKRIAVTSGQLLEFRLDERGDGWLAIARSMSGSRRAAPGTELVLERRSNGALADTISLGRRESHARVVFDPTGARMAIWGDGSIEVRSTADGAVLHRLREPEPGPGALALDSGGHWLAAGNTGRGVHLYRLSDGSLRTLTGHTEGVMGLAFTSDGLTLASGSMDFSLRLWDVVRGAPLTVARGRSHVYGVGFDRRGTLVAGGGPDGLMNVWDPATGAVRLKLQTSAESVASVAFSPDGRWLATSGAQKVDVFDLDAWRSPGRQIDAHLARSLFEVSGSEERLQPRALTAE
jgi:WD40 repeat protein